MFVEIYNLCLTLSWNYMELFVMMVSIGLFTRFNQINARIRELDMKVRELNCVKMIEVFQKFIHIIADNQRNDLDQHSI